MVAIIELKSKSQKFSEGCSDELSDVGKSVLVHLAADLACAGSVLSTVESAGLANKLAVFSCGVAVPLATVEVFEKHRKWKECKEFVSFHDKYKQHCEGKGFFLHVYKDALICASDDIAAPLVRIDLKKETVELLKVKK